MISTLKTLIAPIKNIIGHLHIIIVAEPELLIGPGAQPRRCLVAELFQVQASLLNSEFRGCETFSFLNQSESAHLTHGRESRSALLLLTIAICV